MASGVVDGRTAILIPQRRFADFLTSDTSVSGTFTRRQRNDFMIALVHESVHLRNPHFLSPADVSQEQRLAEELRAWRTVNQRVVRPLRASSEPMHSMFIRVDDALIACGERPDCQPLTQAMVPQAASLTP
jgi:hypothetical protein